MLKGEGQRSAFVLVSTTTRHTDDWRFRLAFTYATRGLSMNDSSESSPTRSNSTLFSNILGTIRSEQRIIKSKTLCCWAGGAWFWSCFLYYIVPTYLFTTSIVISHTLFFFPPILIHETSIFLLCTTYYKLQAQKHCSIVGKNCAGMYLLFLLNTYNLFWYDLFPNNIIAPYGDTPWSIFWKRFSCVLFFTWMSLDSCFLNKAANIIKDFETNGWTSWSVLLDSSSK